MMRSPSFMATAVRRNDGTIAIKELPWRSLSEKLPFLKLPFLRGILSLIESMSGGIKSLGFSAEEAAADDSSGENKEAKSISSLEIGMSMVAAFGFGLLFFVALPHLITHYLGQAGLFDNSLESYYFHIIDGAIKSTFLVAYILAISLMPDIKRVFQYHGAEHKSIYAFEHGDELTVENAKKYPTLHPRCGTSFLLFLVVISVFVFSAIFPTLMSFYGIKSATEGPAKLGIIFHLGAVILKMFLMLPIAGISYEIIRLSGNYMHNPIVKILISPGLLLQKITTKEPSESQLEVALAALRRVLLLEKAPEHLNSSLVVIKNPGDIPRVNANVMEFEG